MFFIYKIFIISQCRKKVVLLILEMVISERMKNVSVTANKNHYKTVISFPDSNHLGLRNCWFKFAN